MNDRKQRFLSQLRRLIRQGRLLDSSVREGFSEEFWQLQRESGGDLLFDEADLNVLLSEFRGDADEDTTRSID